MGVQEIIAQSKKKMQLEALKKRNEEIDKLIDKLTEVEEQIRQENLEQYIMPKEVDELVQEKTKDDVKKEEEETRKLYLEKENKKSKLEDEERALEESFSNKVQGSVNDNQKWLGYLKRYVIIGMVTGGFPGIAIAYLFDKWQENRMIKELYQAHINTIVYPDNVELQKIYQRKRNEFYKVYDIDKIEKNIKESGIITQIKNDRAELLKLNEEIKITEEMYLKSIDIAIDKEAEIMQLEEEELLRNQEEIDEELQLEIKPN